MKVITLLMCLGAQDPVMRFTNLWDGKLVTKDESLHVDVAIYGQYNAIHTITINGENTFSNRSGFEGRHADITFPPDGIVSTESGNRKISVKLKVVEAKDIVYLKDLTLAEAMGALRTLPDKPVSVQLKPGIYAWPDSYPGGRLTRKMPIMFGAKAPGEVTITNISADYSPHLIFSLIKISGSSPSPYLYTPDGTFIELYHCEIAPLDNKSPNYVNRGIAFGGGRKIIIGCKFHDVGYAIVGGELIQNNTFLNIGEDAIHGANALIEGNIGVKSKAWDNASHPDTIQWYAGTNGVWSNIIVRHNVFIDQSSQGFFARQQIFNGLAIVGNLWTAGEEKFHAFHFHDCQINQLYMYHNTVIGGFAGLLIRDGSYKDLFILNNVFSSDGTDRAFYTGHTVNFNAQYGAAPYGKNSVGLLPNDLFPPLFIPTIPFFGVPIAECDRTMGLLNYPNPPQIGWIPQLK
jgi:hypothetical protein